jgi:hypothetical protein
MLASSRIRRQMFLTGVKNGQNGNGACRGSLAAAAPPQVRNSAYVEGATAEP